MSVHYIIDGYNLIQTQKDFFPGNLEKSRNILLNQIKFKHPEGSSRNKITVVFDGQPGINFPGPKGVDVKFTSGKEADWMIKEMVRKHPNPAQIFLITDDRVLGAQASVSGAAIISTRDFIKKLFPAKIKNSAKDEKELSFEVKQKINKEFEQIWLDKE